MIETEQKLPDIPKELYEAILSKVVEVMRNDRVNYSDRSFACSLVMLTQLGLRLGDLLAMGAVGTFGGRKKGILEYNAFYDSNDPEGEKRKNSLLGQSKIYLNGSEDYVGNHELGHILVTTLNEGKTNEEASHIQNNNILEEDILESVLQNPEVMDREKYSQLKRYTDKRVKEKAEKFGQHVLKGQIDLTKSHLPSQGYTSEYGGQNSAEFFAEAVHDVYANGSKAKKASVEAIKEYEKRQKKVTKNRFFKQKRGIFRKFLDLFKF